jgi:hypothetical protein
MPRITSAVAPARRCAPRVPVVDDAESRRCRRGLGLPPALTLRRGDFCEVREDDAAVDPAVLRESFSLRLRGD